MRAEGDERPVPHREAFQKGRYRHGEGPPPIGVADEQRVVRCRVRLQGGNGRPDIAPLLLFGHLHHGIILLRVGGEGRDLRHIAAREALDAGGKPAGIAGMGKVDDQHGFSSCGGGMGRMAAQQRRRREGREAKGGAPQELTP